MSKQELEQTYEDKRDPQFINVAAIEAERNLINKLFKWDRTRRWREWGQWALILFLGVLVYDLANRNQVEVYQIKEGLDGVEQVDLLEPYTVDASMIAQESREWLEYVRGVSIDKVVEDKHRNTALAAMDTIALKTQLFQYIKSQVDMPENGTRDVLENTFSFSQLSSGQKGLYTFVWKWYETESFALEPRGAYEMQATVTMRTRPATKTEMRKGKFDPLFVAFFDINMVRSLDMREMNRILARKS